MGRNRTSVGRTAILVVATLPFLYPFFFLVSTAFKPLADFNNDEIGLPRNPTTENLAKRLVDRRPGPRDGALADRGRGGRDRDRAAGLDGSLLVRPAPGPHLGERSAGS